MITSRRKPFHHLLGTAIMWCPIAYGESIESIAKRGEYLTIAADCGACHSTAAGRPFAGGLPIVTPVGTICSTNITPSLSSGIGAYKEADFSRALRSGVRKDGANLYPAMPYTAYARMSDFDIHALYVYFMHSVAAVDARPCVTSLPFPMNVRASMAAWNWLFFDGNRWRDDPGQTSEWNRGGYLVEGPAHCGTCHTPRGWLMQELKQRAFSGAQDGAWFAPNITPAIKSGIGTWTTPELSRYLKSGRLHGHAQAAGSMGEAVQHSFQFLTDADLSAIAAYMRTLPKLDSPPASYSRFEHGGDESRLGSLRGNATTSRPDADLEGAKLYQGNCASCHAPEAEGSQDGYYPSLFSNSATVVPNNLIAAIVEGVNRTTVEGQAFMPAFGATHHAINPLSDRDITLLANYVLTHFGDFDHPVSENDVRTVSAGGPHSNLAGLARLGVVGVIITASVLAWWLYRRRILAAGSSGPA